MKEDWHKGRGGNKYSDQTHPPVGSEEEIHAPIQCLQGLSLFSSLNISYPWLANCQGLLVPRRKGLGLGGGSVVKHTPCTPSIIEKGNSTKKM